jgi:hypothetical protein
MGLPEGALIFAIGAAFAALMFYAGTFCIHASERYSADKQYAASVCLVLFGAASLLMSGLVLFLGPVLTVCDMVHYGGPVPGDDVRHFAMAVGTLALIVGLPFCTVARRHARQGAAVRGRVLHVVGIAGCLAGVLSWLGLFGIFG